MKFPQSVARAACVLAVCGMLVPAGIQAAPPAKAKPAKDVALSGNGSLTGALVTPEGQPLDGAVVSIRQGGKEVTQAVSDAKGTFQVAGLNNGVYELAVGQQVTSVRTWPANIAPPSATPQAVLVVGNASRAQYGSGMTGLDLVGLTTLGASVTAAVLSGVALSQINDVDNKVDKLASP